MVHPLWRHRDKVNYNGPKVSESLAPVVSNDGVCIRLYAGNPEYPALLIVRSVTMRPVRTISRKDRGEVGSGILRDHTPSSHSRIVG